MLGKSVWGLALSLCLYSGTSVRAEGPHGADPAPSRPRAAGPSVLEQRFQDLLRLRDADSYHTRMRADREIRALLAANFAEGTAILARLQAGTSLEVSRGLDVIRSASESSWDGVRMGIQDRLIASPQLVQARAGASNIVDRLVADETDITALADAYQRTLNEMHVQRRLAMYPNGVENPDFESAPRVLKAKRQVKEAAKLLGQSLRRVVVAAGFRIERLGGMVEDHLVAEVSRGGQRFEIDVNGHSANVRSVGQMTIPMRTLLTPLQLARLGAAPDRPLEDVAITAPVVRSLAYRDPESGIVTRTTTATIDSPSRLRILSSLTGRFPRHENAISTEFQGTDYTETASPGLTFVLP